MIIWIGEEVLYNGIVHHVQDTNFLSQSALIGIPDHHGLIWDKFWVPWDQLMTVCRNGKTNNEKNQ
jgi:hypothetical protein